MTDCILKTEQLKVTGDSSTIKVYAHGYQSARRLTCVSTWGGDGRFHRVPVYWDEYAPVAGSGEIYMEEDNGPEDGPVAQSQRLGRIDSMPDKANLDSYRRHIASRVGGGS